LVGLSGSADEKLLERMATSENTTLVIKREGDGKIRVASRHWEEAEVTGKNEMLEVRSVDGRLDVARKERKPDEWDPPVEPYDPYRVRERPDGRDGRDGSQF
jgi:hypothetical protein